MAPPAAPGLPGRPSRRRRPRPRVRPFLRGTSFTPGRLGWRRGVEAFPEQWADREHLERVRAIESLRRVGVLDTRPRGYVPGPHLRVADLPLVQVCSWLPPVRPRPAAYFEPVRQWLRWQRRYRGHRIYVHGWRRAYDAYGHHRLPRWEWPPLPQAPTYGWRGRLIAWHTLRLKAFANGPRQLRVRLNAVATGRAPFGLHLVRRVERALREAAAAERPAPPPAPSAFRVSLGPRGARIHLEGVSGAPAAPAPPDRSR